MPQVKMISIELSPSELQHFTLAQPILNNDPASATAALEMVVQTRNSSNEGLWGAIGLDSDFNDDN